MARKERWDRSQPPPPTVQHGRYTTYNNYGCRCAPCKADHNRYKNAHRAANIERYRERDAAYQERRDRSGDPAYNRRRRYALTQEQFDAMLNEQDGVCAICLSDFGAKGPHVDHDHACCPEGKSCGECIRGLLCWACNGAIGKLKDDPEIIMSAARYVAERNLKAV